MAKAKINKAFLSAALVSLVSSTALATDIEANTARMQAMDKITGRVSEIDVPVNAPVKFGSFSILVRKCVTRPPEETPENTAFVDVVDDYNQKEPVNIFKGWMMSSTPAVNAVEHPIYDVWLLKCFDKSSNQKKLSAQELETRDEIRMVRGEKAPIMKTDAPEPTQEEAPASTTASALEDVIKATIATEAEVAPTMPATAPTEQPAMMVVAPSVDTPQDENAPVALFQIQQQPTEEKPAEPVVEAAPVIEAAPIAESPAPLTQAPNEVIEVNAETIENTVQPEPAPTELQLQPEINSDEQEEVIEENGYETEEFPAE